MDQALFVLMAAGTTFVGSHFLLSHPLRKWLASTLGESGFLGVYSLIALAAFGWMAAAFAAAPRGPAWWDGTTLMPWIAASLLTYAALALLIPSFSRNPALPKANLEGLSTREPRGVFCITRHPMMMAFALWALSHMIVAPTARSFMLGTAILILSLVGARLQDRRKLAQNPHEWSVWIYRTSFWPDLTHVRAIGAAWVVALAVWLLVTATHLWLAGIPAGVWVLAR